MKKRLIILLLFTIAVASTVIIFNKQRASAQLDQYDIQCQNWANGNGAIAGFGRFPNSVDLFPGQTTLTTFRTYVCNAYDETVQDETITSNSSVVLETGRPNAINFGPTGWTGPDAQNFLHQYMGTFTPHTWRRRDVQMGINEAAFDGPGTYTIQVSGKGWVWHNDFGCFYPAPCNGVTNTIQMNLSITINRPQITCDGMTLNPPLPVPGSSVTVTTRYAAPDNSLNNIYRLGAYITAPNGAVTGDPDVAYTLSGNNALSYTFPTFVDGGGGVYSVRTVLDVPGASWFTPLECTSTFTVSFKPYYRVYGGDIFVGAGFTDGLTCPTNPNSGIVSWNNGANPYTGSGSQLGVFSLGFIFDFSSGQLRNRSLPKTQTFPTTNPSFNGWGLTEYGGGLDVNNGAANCAPDYYAERTTGTPLGAAWTIPSSANGVYSRTGNLALTSNSSGMINGESITIFVDGDVTISDNITYASVNYGSINDIPRFTLIVQGNIYISPNVTQLDGTYIAQPDPASPNDTGRFYTCWTGNIPTTANINGPCRSAGQLTVYGAVAAELIKLTRSRGSMTDSVITERYDNTDGDPAEVFIYTPEVWLGGGIGNDEGFDALTTLPPIL